jgi:hypothetical protein
MLEWTLDEAVAEAILTGRALKIPTLRGMAEKNFGRAISDRLWAQLEPKWKWHEALSSEKLR